MDLPIEAEICEQVFLAQPKAHRTKYAEKHWVVETDILKLQEFFEGCHDADVHSGKYKKIIDAKKKASDQGKPKKEERCIQGKLR